MRDVRESIPSLVNAPSGPKQRDWGKPPSAPSASGKTQGLGKGSQGYGKPVGFVKAEDANAAKDPVRGDKLVTKTDEELEAERKEQRRQEEEVSFKDVCWSAFFPSAYVHYFLQRELRYEPRERARIANLDRAILRDRQQKEKEEKDRIEIRDRLDIWDDDESDEMFYVDRYGFFLFRIIWD